MALVELSDGEASSILGSHSAVVCECSGDV